MKRTLLALLVTALVTGCGTTGASAQTSSPAQQVAAGVRGDTADVVRLAQESIRSGNYVASSWHNLGAAYERQGLAGPSIRAFTMAARYGHNGSRLALVAHGAPVPRADLVERAPERESNSDTAAYLLNAFNRGYSGGVNCTTMSTGDLARTSCR